MKTASVFFGTKAAQAVRENVKRYRWARDMQEEVLRAAAPFLSKSDEEIRGLVPSYTITRSWMVWSEGYCPECRQEVRMYFWKHDPIRHPWKVECPHCHARFPKNDFRRFYESGLDEGGIFRRERADESLLYNEEDRDGSLRSFGVDDGEGYVEGDRRWRFIGNYIIYSGWKKQVVGGLKALSNAWLFTGDAVYAHKAGILLERIADLLQAFDFDRQGLVYEQPHTAEGYVSYCIDSTTELKEIVLAYDRVYEALDDRLRQKIENGILVEVQKHPEKIRSNPPHTELTLLVIKSVLGCSGEEIRTEIGKIVEHNTGCDGVQGEKGIAGYSAMSTKGLALLLIQFLDYGEGFIKELLEDYPVLHQTFRFHIDTWCLGQKYYPGTGDGGRFARPEEHYYAVDFGEPRMFTLFWELYRATGDGDFLKVMYRENGFTERQLPHDIRRDDGMEIERAVREYIDREGSTVRLSSLNKENFCIGILRDRNEKYALWMDYAYCGGHAQSGGMAIGMYAKGLDLMPDFGYPPVMFGGWQSPQALWYRLPCAHNTVMVDGRYQKNQSRGKTTLFGIGDSVQVLRVDGKNIADLPQFERTLLMIPVDGEEFYAVDGFRVVGGRDHAKFTYSGFGCVTTGGLTLGKTEDYGYGSLIDHTAGDPFPEPGYYVDWRIDDRYHASEKEEVHFRYTDFTYHTSAAIGRAWICTGDYAGEKTDREEDHIPVVISRRRIENGLMLTSHFVSVLEAYEKRSSIRSMRRLDLAYPNGIVCPDLDSCLEITLENGAVDFIVQLDTEDVIYNKFCKDRTVTQAGWRYESDAKLLVLRMRDGKPETLFACGFTSIRLFGEEIRLEGYTDMAEWKRIDKEFRLIRRSE